jgi:hypothetical protein
MAFCQAPLYAITVDFAFHFAAAADPAHPIRDVLSAICSKKALQKWQAQSAL